MRATLTIGDWMREVQKGSDVESWRSVSSQCAQERQNLANRMRAIVDVAMLRIRRLIVPLRQIEPQFVPLFDTLSENLSPLELNMKVEAQQPSYERATQKPDPLDEMFICTMIYNQIMAKILKRIGDDTLLRSSTVMGETLSTPYTLEQTPLQSIRQWVAWKLNQLENITLLNAVEQSQSLRTVWHQNLITANGMFKSFEGVIHLACNAIVTSSWNHKFALEMANETECVTTAKLAQMGNDVSPQNIHAYAQLAALHAEVVLRRIDIVSDSRKMKECIERRYYDTMLQPLPA